MQRKPTTSVFSMSAQKGELLNAGLEAHARGFRTEFAADSPLEGDGFEPSVPHKKQPFLAAPVRSRNSPSATKTGSFVPGTDGSNPSPSSGESGANLVFGGNSIDDRRGSPTPGPAAPRDEFHLAAMVSVRPKLSR